MGKAMDWCMSNEAFKVQMFRFVDAYPSLTTSELLMGHLEEYFGQEEGVPSFLKWGLKGAGWAGALGAKIVGSGIRSNIEDMARQFIVGENTREAVKRIGQIRDDGFAAVVDVLGEATVAPSEEEAFEKTYLDLLDALDSEQKKWKPLGGGAGDLDWGSSPKIQVAVKPSGLYCKTKAVDFEHSVRGIQTRMARIFERVSRAGGSMCVDMESLKYKDITLEMYRRLRADAGTGIDGSRLGIVLQAYLRDAEKDLDALLRWARENRLPIALRLVKGAYWDYETVVAKQNGWPVPVWDHKPESDMCFERMSRKILENSDICHFSCASHNIRSIANVLETARQLKVPDSRYEFQVLYGMAEPVRLALLKNIGRVRLYAPYGEIIPGMAYLVRRLLENTANESFLRQSFADGAEIDRLLEDPAKALERTRAAVKPPAKPAPKSAIQNEPFSDFTLASERLAYPAAIAAVRKQLGKTYALNIDGRDIQTSDLIDSVNPAQPSEVVGRICQAGTAEIAQAIAAAKKAFPAWRDTAPAQRAGVLRKAAQIMRRRMHELSAWQVLEVGKQWDQANADIAEAIDFCNYYAAEIERIAKPRRMGVAPGESNQYLYEPKGVTAVIGPWNFPLAISCGMCAASIAAGNTVVYKPSGISAVVGHNLVEIFAEAGLPAGVFNYVPGRGSVMGDFLVEHPDITLIAFTGSMEVGLRIIEKAAKVQPGQAYVKKVVCEMGGKNAIVIDDDADLDEAVPAVLYSAFGFQGQKCSACSRVIVLDAVYDRFVKRLVDAASAMVVGPAEDPHFNMGPVADGAAQKTILGYIELAKREGQIAFQGKVPETGFYVPPTIVTGITPEHRLAQEEVFGPVLAVMRAKDFDQAMAWANSTRFALTGAIFSRSPGHLERAQREFRVGNLYLNRGSTGALVERQPFGGAKMSGVGTKAGGPDYLIHFMDPRVITENTMRRGFTPAEE